MTVSKSEAGLAEGKRHTSTVLALATSGLSRHYAMGVTGAAISSQPVEQVDEQTRHISTCTFSHLPRQSEHSPPEGC